MNKYLANQKLWKIIKQPDGYYYEIKLAGMIIDRVKIESPAYDILKSEGVINDHRRAENKLGGEE